MQEKKYMCIKEFVEKGYLQEVNRRFFHILGLALEVVMDNDEYKLSGVLDFRNDNEGIYYDINNSSTARKTKFEIKKDFINNELCKRGQKRIKELGFLMEEINNVN